MKLSLPLGTLLVLTGIIGGYLLPHSVTTKVVSPAPIVVPSPTATAAPDTHADFTYDNLLVRLNETRLAHNLPQISTDTYLSKEAQDDLVGNCPVTGHSTFRAKFDQGVFKNYAQTGEVLNSGVQTPLDSINEFLGSPTHSDLMVGTSWNWKYVGIGVATSPVNCVSFIFGKQL